MVLVVYHGKSTKTKKVEVAQKTATTKKDKKSLQEIYPQPEDDDGFDEELVTEEK